MKYWLTRQISGLR